MTTQKLLIVFLLLSNLITLFLLISLSTHYRMPQKAYRVLVGEARVPLIKENHAMNRNYAASRQLFDSYSTKKVQSLVVGDSQVSQVNWNELLTGFGAVGRGIDGDTAAGLAARISDYSHLQPEVCIVMIGTNDVWKDRTMTETENAYRDLIKSALQIWPATELILVSVPPFASWVTTAETKNNRVKQTNLLIAELANQTPRTRYLDFHDAITDGDNYLAKEMTMDGVHLNAAAYSVLRGKLIAIEAHK